MSPSVFVENPTLTIKRRSLKRMVAFFHSKYEQGTNTGEHPEELKESQLDVVHIKVICYFFLPFYDFLFELSMVSISK
jgi:hypothetical protein